MGAIPDPTDTLRFNRAIKEILDIGLGNTGFKDSSGQHLDSFVTYRNLEDAILNSEAVGTALSVTILSLIGFGPPSEITISGDAISVTGNNYFRFHTIDTESDAATDDLDTISGGNAGELLLIKPENGSHTVVCKDGASLVLGRDFTMDNIADAILFICISLGVWYPLTKYNAGS